jgi:hypothetical protein
MTYLVILAHLLIVGWGTRVVCCWLHDRRVPRPDDVRAVQAGFVAVCVIAGIALISDVTDGGRRLIVTRLFWDFMELLSILFTGLVILVLRNSSLPRVGKKEGEPTNDGR